MSDRVGSADAAWLHMDRPANLMVINSVLLFDEPLDWERFTDVVRTRMVRAYPRSSQRVVESHVPLLGPHWEHDRDFDLRRHMHRRGLPAPGDEAAVAQLASDLAAVPMDTGKPLWDMYLIDGPGAGSAVVVRMHHCIADGIALARVMLSLTDTRPEGDGFADAPQRRRRRQPALAAASGLLTLARESAYTATHPRRVLDLAGMLAADARSAAKLILTPGDLPGPFKQDAGPRRSVAWSAPLPLEEVKAVAHAQGATVNDVLLTAVTGALRSYAGRLGEEPEPIRAFIPFNLRPLDEPLPRNLGNRFGLVILTLPVDISDRSERLHELKQRMDAIKHSPEGPVSYALLETVGVTPPAVEHVMIDFFSSKVSAVLTNVPGPREPVYLAGTPLRTVLVWAPTAGSVGTSVSIFSYNGEVTVGLLVHADAVPDPRAILDHVGPELKALARLAPNAARA
jgi:WS/DGAT/MGAT family acyltransferase